MNEGQLKLKRRKWFPADGSTIHCGQVLTAARAMAGLTQVELAKVAGLSDRAIRYWELRSSAPSCWSTMAKLQTALRTHGVEFAFTPIAMVRLISKS
jgi:DNA-binding XRE family transcriptional regulator